MSTRWQHIRTTAATVRQHFAERTTSPLMLPLALEDLAEEIWGLTVVLTTTLSPGINGKVEPELEVIRVRRDLPFERQRFVIAHEIGHVALEGLTSGVFLDTDHTIDERAAGESADTTTVSTYNTRERHEQEANLFALELLIPANELWQMIQHPGWTLAGLATSFGVSLDALRTQLVNICCIEPINTAVSKHAVASVLLPPDPEQQAAVDAPLPLLLAAGPGTGKTRSIVAKYVALVQQGINPANILALTFSNKAADEMRGRIVAVLGNQWPELTGQVDISTFHAWGLNLLRTYGPELGVPLNVQLRETGDLYLLLTRHLADLQLDHFKDLSNPSRRLLSIIKAISRIKDEVRTPEEFALLAEQEAIRLLEQATRDHPGTTKKAAEEREKATKKAAALRELAHVYPRYESVLRTNGVLDYGDLIVLAVAALRLPAVAAEVHSRYQYILVDEFQDINYASGELIRLLDGGRGRVWAVGDGWQSIYRFRGASAANLDAFEAHYAGAKTLHLVKNYRSLQPILDASYELMRDDSRATSRPRLLAERGAGTGHHVVEWVLPTRTDEYTAIAHDIIQRVGKHVGSGLPCDSISKRRLLPRRWADRGSRIRIAKTFLRPRIRWQLRDHVVLCRKHDHAEGIAAVLEAHGVPVESVRDVYETSEVKDALAICAQVRALNGAGLLRALTMTDHQLEPKDLNMLVQHARATKQALPRAARDPAIVVNLSSAAQQALTNLHTLLNSLARESDAWQMLTTYLFHHSPVHRERIIRAGRGEGSAQRELTNLGRLLTTARNYVRQAPSHERGASHFVEYIRTLRAAGAMSNQPIAGSPNVVRVMTVHAAKGLEFPIVYIPHLQEGQFPTRGDRRGIALPSTLIQGPNESEEHEERYLLYVAMTRARDRLVLTRSLDGGRKSNGEQKIAQRSSLLPGAADGHGSPWPVRVISVATGCPTARTETRLRSTPAPRMPLPATSIDLDGCRRRYLYQYVYQLYDDQSPFLRVHQAIRETIKRLAELARAGTLPSTEEQARTLLHGQFQRYELDDVLYADDYAAEAWHHVRPVWEDMRSGQLTPNDVNVHMTVSRPAGTIEVRVDRIDGTGEKTRLVWTRSGTPGSDDHLKERVMLYALAQQEQENIEIAIHYTATGEMRTATPNPKVLANHTAKIDALLETIQEGLWIPSFGPHCDTCPFNLICPV